MAMPVKTIQRIFLRHAGNDDKVYATLRLSREQYDVLRAAMHTPVGEKVKFAHGVHMYAKGFGWYKLFTTNEFRATEKIQTALQTIAAIIHRLDRVAKQTARGVLTTTTPIVAFTEYGGYHHAVVLREKPAGHKVEHTRAPTQEKLNALAAKWGRQ